MGKAKKTFEPFIDKKSNKLGNKISQYPQSDNF